MQEEGRAGVSLEERDTESKMSVFGRKKLNDEKSTNVHVNTTVSTPTHAESAEVESSSLADPMDPRLMLSDLCSHDTIDPMHHLIWGHPQPRVEAAFHAQQVC